MNIACVHSNVLPVLLLCQILTSHFVISSTLLTIVSKRLNVESRKQRHTIAHELWFSGVKDHGEIRIFTSVPMCQSYVKPDFFETQYKM